MVYCVHSPIVANIAGEPGSGTDPDSCYVNCTTKAGKSGNVDTALWVADKGVDESDRCTCVYGDSTVMNCWKKGTIGLPEQPDFWDATVITNHRGHVLGPCQWGNCPKKSLEYFTHTHKKMEWWEWVLIALVVLLVLWGVWKLVSKKRRY